VTDALVPSAWYSKSPGRHCTAHSDEIESAQAQESALPTLRGIHCLQAARNML
jgi:hypothetical protein